MLYFTCTVEIISEHSPKALRINKLKYFKYYGVHGNMRVPLILPTTKIFHIGDVITSDKATITNLGIQKELENICVRMEEPQLLDIEFNPGYDQIPMIANGLFKYSEKSTLERRGRTHSLCYPCTLGIENEVGEKFNMFCIGYNAVAKAISKQRPRFADVKCLLSIGNNSKVKTFYILVIKGFEVT